MPNWAQTVQIGVQKYHIRYPKGLEALGEFDMDEAVIRIRRGLPPLTHATTLLHELFHAIADTLGAGLSEEQVRVLEQGFARFFQDHPALSRDLLEAIIKGD